MTKNIVIVNDNSTTKKKPTKGKKKTKRNTPPYYLKDPVEIKKQLEGFVQIKSVKECNVLIPYRTIFRIYNKEESGLRNFVYFVKVTDTGVMVSIGKYIWQVSFDKNKIYAKLDVQEDIEKSFFVDFLKSCNEEGTLKFTYKGRSVNMDKLVEIYGETTL